MTPGPRAIGYVRVSTEQQAETGVSLEAQADKIRTMARLQDATLAEVIIDKGESAKSLQRPGMARLLALVDAGAVTTVIIAKLDRLTRSVRDLSELLQRFERARVALLSAAEVLDTGSAHGRLVLNILVSVGQWEREAIGDRTRAALSHLKAKGERVGTLPFGFQVGDDRKLAPAPVEQRLLADMRALKAEGCSTRQIAALLNLRGSATRRGTPWRFQYVARVLKCA